MHSAPNQLPLLCYYLCYGLPVVSGERPGGTCSCYFDVSPAKTGPVRGVMQIPCLNLKSFSVKVLKGPHIIVRS